MTEKFECPECSSENVKDNRFNEHICNDCGECFYFSHPDNIEEAKRNAYTAEVE